MRTGGGESGKAKNEAKRRIYIRTVGRSLLGSILIEMKSRKRFCRKKILSLEGTRLVLTLVSHQSGASILKRDLYSLTGDRLICVFIDTGKLSRRARYSFPDAGARGGEGRGGGPMSIEV